MCAMDGYLLANAGKDWICCCQYYFFGSCIFALYINHMDIFAIIYELRNLLSVSARCNACIFFKEMIEISSFFKT